MWWTKMVNHRHLSSDFRIWRGLKNKYPKYSAGRKLTNSDKFCMILCAVGQTDHLEVKKSGTSLYVQAIRSVHHLQNLQETMVFTTNNQQKSGFPVDAPFSSTHCIRIITHLGEQLSFEASESPSISEECEQCGSWSRPICFRWASKPWFPQHLACWNRVVWKTND